MVKHLFLYSLVGLALVGFLFSRRGAKPEQADEERSGPTVDASGLVRVGSIRLWQDYEANEIAADNRYKDKTVRVVGRVLEVEKNMLDAAVLHLVSGNPVFRTMATLTPEDTPRAAALTKGTRVVVQCVGKGRMMRMPQLEECDLYEPL